MAHKNWFSCYRVLNSCWCDFVLEFFLNKFVSSSSVSLFSENFQDITVWQFNCQHASES